MSEELILRFNSCKKVFCNFFNRHLLEDNKMIFILHGRDLMKFCDHYFDFYIDSCFQNFLQVNQEILSEFGIINCVMKNWTLKGLTIKISLFFIPNKYQAYNRNSHKISL